MIETTEESELPFLDDMCEEVICTNCGDAFKGDYCLKCDCEHELNKSSWNR